MSCQRISSHSKKQSGIRFEGHLNFKHVASKPKGHRCEDTSINRAQWQHVDKAEKRSIVRRICLEGLDIGK